MKGILLFFLLLNIHSYAQKLKDVVLNSSWVCTRITDTNGNDTRGKFGDSKDYLRFRFSKDVLTISQAPFDKGMEIAIYYNRNTVELAPNIIPSLAPEFAEKIYTLKSGNADSIVLTTTTRDGNELYYHFVNQNKFLNSENIPAGIIEDRVIIIRHTINPKTNSWSNKFSEYRISNTVENFSQSPVFSETGGFGNFFAANFIFPKSYLMESVSDELILDMDIVGKEIRNVKFIKGLNEEMNSSVLKTISKANKKWEPVKIGDKPQNSTLRFHFIFYLGEGGLDINANNNGLKVGRRISLKNVVNIDSPVSKIWQVLTDSSFIKQWCDLSKSVQYDKLISGSSIELSASPILTVSAIATNKAIKFFVSDPAWKTPSEYNISVLFQLTEEQAKTQLAITIGDFSPLVNSEEYYQLFLKFANTACEKIKFLSEH